MALVLREGQATDDDTETDHDGYTNRYYPTIEASTATTSPTDAKNIGFYGAKFDESFMVQKARKRPEGF